jgi:hypothetical protein
VEGVGGGKKSGQRIEGCGGNVPVVSGAVDLLVVTARQVGKSLEGP